MTRMSFAHGVAAIAIAVFSLTGAAQAQQTAPATTPADGNVPGQDSQPGAVEDSSNAGQSGDVVVTGSRIRRQDFSTPSPIVTLDAKTFEAQGTTNVTDFLRAYPALVGSGGSSNNSGDRAGIGETGLNTLDLRNLGRQRTLTLVDGRRHVSGIPGEQAVDINTIPTDLIEGVDILTGGASAVYGADGVSGVVNFRLKQNFDGLTVRGQAGISDRGDSGQRLVAVTGGRNFADSRGNVALAYQYSMDDRLQAKQRPQFGQYNLPVFTRNPNGTVPARVPITDARYYGSSPEGAVDVDGDGVPDFTGTGAVYDNGVPYPGGYSVGGSSTPVARYLNDLQPSIERHIANFLGHYDISDSVTLFGEAKYATTKSFSLAQPTFDYNLLIQGDNPYLPANIRSAIDPTIGGVLVSRDNFDLGMNGNGQRGENIKRDTYRTVIGLRGDLEDKTHYEVSYVFGRTDVRSQYTNDIYSDRFFAALDAVRDPATGQITCRANLDPNWTPNQPYSSGRKVLPRTTFQPGQCRPINILGAGLSDPSGIAFILAPTTDRSRIEQHVVSASVSGDFEKFFSLPGGPLAYAFGAEYRKEISSFTPDPIEQQGLTFTNALSATRGSFDVKEVFAELNAPIAKNMRFAHDLELGAAIRVSDYSTIGRATTWKVDGMYSPIRDITFRGTYSVAIRAPNISELFGGRSQTFAFFTEDPCIPANTGNGTQYRAANCRTLLQGLGANPATYNDTRSFNVSGTSGGNPLLRQEEANTWTAGLVLAPRFIPGLTLSADWYDIRLKNAINTVTPIQLAQLCVDSPTLNNQFCGAITRQNGAGTGTVQAGNVIGFNVAPQNVASFQTAGLDLNLNWRLPTANMGLFNLQVNGNYLDKLLFIGVPGAPVTDYRGTAFSSAPKYQVTSNLSWAKGVLTLNYGLQWFDKTLRYTRETSGSNPDFVAAQYYFIKPRWVHNIYASVDATERFQFYGGVSNLFDQMPDVGQTIYPTTAVGRFMFVGARVKM